LEEFNLSKASTFASYYKACDFGFYPHSLKMLFLLSFLRLKPSKGSLSSSAITCRALCMKALSLLSFVLFESLKDSSTSALLAAVALVHKGTFPPELLFSETLKGFLDLL
jgi:hypothetical protein